MFTIASEKYYERTKENKQKWINEWMLPRKKIERPKINRFYTIGKLSATEIHTSGRVSVIGDTTTRKWINELGRIKEE